MSIIVSSSGPIQVPTNARELLTQASKRLHAVLGLNENQCCLYITTLEKDHANISKLCEQALNYEKNKPYPLKRMLFEAVIAGCIATGVGFVLANVYSLQYKTFFKICLLMSGFLQTSSVYKNSQEESSDFRLKARMERNWIEMKLAVLEKKIQESEHEIGRFVSCKDYDWGQNPNILAARDQMLLLKSYFQETLKLRNY